MLQYLLNTTAIWLISLILFDVFLRRENYHNYNRFYLLLTFLLGALLPLWQWQDSSRLYSEALQRPLQQIITTKQSIVSAATQVNNVTWQQFFLIIYLIGAVTALSILIMDVIKLLKFYRNGGKSMQDGWTIIETNKGHAPFSFISTLFVGSISQYDADEWNMILVHEKQHTALFHFIDLLLMQAAHIIFWFHPLVYAYNKRLLLVHEYQADNSCAQQPQKYGTFLVEQALLTAAPALSHSLNRSPIKKRILMLTRKSSVLAKSKMVVFIPLALVCIICFTRSGFPQAFIRNGNIVTYKGNTFELSKPHTDTQIITDPRTGREFTKYITLDPAPIKMNGQLILREVDKYPYFKGDDKNLRAYLLKNLKNELSKLDDGTYRLDISSVLIGENGAIVYFDGPDIYNYLSNDEIEKKRLDGSLKPPSDNSDISKTIRQEVFVKSGKLMDAATLYIPAELNGRKVVTWIMDGNKFWNPFKIKDHKLYDRNSSNEYVPL